jgi:transposase
LRAQLTTTHVEIEHLKLLIAKLRRMQFGRKSEKLDHQIEQLELQLEDLQATEGEAEREMPPVDQAPRSKPVRKPLPDHLPRDEKVYPPAVEACPDCGGGLRQLGEDVAEQLEFVPAGCTTSIRMTTSWTFCSVSASIRRHWCISSHRGSGRRCLLTIHYARTCTPLAADMLVSARDSLRLNSATSLPVPSCALNPIRAPSRVL